MQNPVIQNPVFNVIIKKRLPMDYDSSFTKWQKPLQGYFENIMIKAIN